MDKGNRRLKPELLAPAGNMDALKAAVQNGADAVYLGASAFNARQFAGNFDDENLKRGIEYAHIRGVNIYLAMNTLLSGTELLEALEMAYKAYCFGSDGIIVQDLGLSRLIRKNIPKLPLHASTQTTVYNLDGVRAMENLGFGRVVLARELSIDEIKKITGSSSAEIEVFIHGALCVSYSGQCLMSSMIGGRSGNRGRCAQPCRMKYSLVNSAVKDAPGKKESPDRNELSGRSGFLMSPKDLCSLEFLPEVIETGIASLKIEGRMKTPEYVGVVTGTYRKYLDLAWEQREGYKVHRKDLEDITQIFNRGGFTGGYLKGNPGSGLVCREKPKNWGIPIGEVISYDAKRRQAAIRLKDKLSLGDGIEIWNDEDESPGTVVSFLKQNGAAVQQARPGEAVAGELKGRIQKGSRVYRTSSKELNERIRKSFAEGTELKKINMAGNVTVKLGLPLQVIIEDRDGNKVSEAGTIPAEGALKKALDEERLKEQFKKTGATPFEFESLNISLDEGVALPVSEINLVRRTALEQLEDKRANKYIGRCREINTENSVKDTFKPVKKERIESCGMMHKAVNPKLSVYFYRLEDAEALIGSGININRVYVPLSGYLVAKDRFIYCTGLLKQIADQVFLSFPPVTRGNYDRYINRNLEEISALPVDGFLIGNHGMLRNEVLRSSNKLIAGDISLNAFNGLTAEVLKREGLAGAALSQELTLQQIMEITGSNHYSSTYMEYEVIIHGRLPVMTSEYCPVGACRDRGKGDRKCPGDCLRERHCLKDRTGALFPVFTDPIDCRSIIFNSSDLFIGKDIKKVFSSGADYFRINFLGGHDGDHQEIRKLAGIYSRMLAGDASADDDEYNDFINEMKLKGYNKGHFFRGV